MDEIRERVVGAIQRDRLATFLKEVDEQKSGCFYFALLSSWEAMFPRQVIDRNIEKRIRENGDNFGVKDTEVMQRVKQLEDVLHMAVPKVGVTGFVKESLMEARMKFDIPPEVGIFRFDNVEAVLESTETNGIIFWQLASGEEIGHFTSLSPSKRFSGTERMGANIGGKEGMNIVMKKGFTPKLVFYLEKKEVDK